MNFNNVREYNEYWKHDDGSVMTAEEIAAEVAEYKNYMGYNYDGYIKVANQRLFTNCWAE